MQLISVGKNTNTFPKRYAVLLTSSICMYNTHIFKMHSYKHAHAIVIISDAFISIFSDRESFNSLV